VLSWYSTIHHEPARIDVPLAEFARVLRPGGLLALGFFDGAPLTSRPSRPYVFNANLNK